MTPLGCTSEDGLWRCRVLTRGFGTSWCDCHWPQHVWQKHPDASNRQDFVFACSFSLLNAHILRTTTFGRSSLRTSCLSMLQRPSCAENITMEDNTGSRCMFFFTAGACSLLANCGFLCPCKSNATVPRYRQVVWVAAEGPV